MMSTFWPLQLDIPGKKPKFKHKCLLLDLLTGKEAFSKISNADFPLMFML